MKNGFAKNGFARRISVADALILAGIGFYQRFISPRKGWRCAHSVLHGGCGCSQAVANLIADNGWRKSRPLIRERFRNCALARETLLERSEMMGQCASKKPRKTRKHGGKSWADNCCLFDCNWCHCANFLADCGPGDVGCCDCNPFCH